MSSNYSGRTGEINRVSGIFRSVGCHSVERSIPEFHTFPPCAHCHSAITWILVRAAQTR
jgi:hypothetical protein